MAREAVCYQPSFYSDSMNILLCNFEYPPLGGGGGVISSLLAQELAKRHHVTVLTSQGFGMPERSREMGVDVVRVPVYFRDQKSVANVRSMGAFLFSGIHQGRRVLAEKSFDIVSTHFVVPTGPVGQFLAYNAKIPNVLSLYGGDLYDPSKRISPHRHLPLRWLIRTLLRRATIVVGGSKNTIENMHRFYAPGIDAVRVPLAIKRPKADVASRARYGFTERDILLVTVGRLVQRKGVEQLIEMVQRLRTEQQPVHLLVVGSGPDEEKLRMTAQSHQVEDAIHFWGFVDEDEKIGLLHMADLYVSTSQHEGFGLVFLEAMACGLPIVCYDYGGQTDFLVDDQTGYMVALNDLDLFTQRCKQLIEQPERREQIGKENHRRVEEFYIDHYAKRHEDLFEEAILMHRSARSFVVPVAHHRTVGGSD